MIYEIHNATTKVLTKVVLNSHDLKVRGIKRGLFLDSGKSLTTVWFPLSSALKKGSAVL